MPQDESEKAELVVQAAIENGLRSCNPGVVSTGLRTHLARYDSVRYAYGCRVAEQFLVSSRLRRGDVEMGLSVSAYFKAPATTMLAIRQQLKGPHSDRIPLPRSMDVKMSV
jgi:hypothetical protein